ncbi:MAG: ATP-binding protein [Loktanella sp.]|nr:ATP-binding protein [Loktanella sp.]
MPTALADVIDNSITAAASSVRIHADTLTDDPTIEIFDDGAGMDRDALVEALRPGGRNPREDRSENDLRRFGLGLKSASFSQCRRLTVASYAVPVVLVIKKNPAHVRLDRLNAGAPFLKVHELDTLDAVIGSVAPGSTRIENGRGIALVRISERADVEPIWRDIQAGHIRAVSIGSQVHRFEVSKPEAVRELWRAVDWTPFEVAVGAEPAAGFRVQHPLQDCVLHDASSLPTSQSAGYAGHAASRSNS